MLIPANLLASTEKTHPNPRETTQYSVLQESTWTIVLDANLYLMSLPTSYPLFCPSQFILACNRQYAMCITCGLILLADRTIGRAFGTVCRLSVCRLSDICRL